MTPSLSRLTVNTEDLNRHEAIVNGLWTCRLNGNATSPTPVAVGIYARGGGEESVMVCITLLQRYVTYFKCFYSHNM